MLCRRTGCPCRMFFILSLKVTSIRCAVSNPGSEVLCADSGKWAFSHAVPWTSGRIPLWNRYSRRVRHTYVVQRFICVIARNLFVVGSSRTVWRLLETPVHSSGSGFPPSVCLFTCPHPTRLHFLQIRRITDRPDRRGKEGSIWASLSRLGTKRVRRPNMTPSL